MSDRTPEHRHAVADWLNHRVEWNPGGDVWKPATVVSSGKHIGLMVIELDENGQRITVSEHHIRKIDPSNPETRQTPSPAQEPSDGEKTRERPNAGQDGVLYAESVGCVYVPDPSEANTWRVFQRIDGDSGDAGAVPDDAVPVPNGQMAAWWRRQLRATADRADAAEAKLATLGANLAEAREELEIARLPHEAPYVDPEHQGGNCIDVIMQKIGETLTAERERDEARVKLDQVREVLADWRAGGFNSSVHQRIRAITEPVTDREEPAQETARVVRKQPGKYELLYDEDDDSYSIVPVGEKPASAWDVEADTHRISEDHEEPAPDGTDGSLIAEYERNRRVMPPCCRRCWEPERSCRCVEGFWSSATLREPEEPAGETKPRVVLGWTVPDHVAADVTTGSVTATCSHGDCSSAGMPFRVWRITSNGWDIEPWLRAHAHGQPVERQADSEAQR